MGRGGEEEERRSVYTFSQLGDVRLGALVKFSSKARLNFNDGELLLLLLADVRSPRRPRDRLAAGAAF